MPGKIVLCDLRDEGGTQHLEATLKTSGELVVAGQDLGPGVSEVFGVSEYEWAWTISPAECKKLHAALGTESDLMSALGEQFSGERASRLRPFLDSHGIEYKSWSRLGD